MNGFDSTIQTLSGIKTLYTDYEYNTNDIVSSSMHTTTLYVNNSSFKNMHSSGLLSYLEEGSLKDALATYYEVDFKAVEAANDFFDQEGIIFNNYFFWFGFWHRFNTI
jgi:hypothetical protein